MLMNWRRLPSGSYRRSRNPGESRSSEVRAADTVVPSTVTSALPPVRRRSGPGTRIRTAMHRVYRRRAPPPPRSLRGVELHHQRAALRALRCAGDEVVEDQLRPALHAEVVAPHRLELQALPLELLGLADDGGAAERFDEEHEAEVHP